MKAKVAEAMLKKAKIEHRKGEDRRDAQVREAHKATETLGNLINLVRNYLGLDLTCRTCLLCLARCVLVPTHIVQNQQDFFLNKSYLKPKTLQKVTKQRLKLLTDMKQRQEC